MDSGGAISRIGFETPVRNSGKEPHQARTLRFVIWSLLFVTDTQFFIFFYLLPDNWPRWLATILTLNCTLPPLLFLNRRGHTRLASHLLMAVLWMLATSLAFTASGIHALAIFTYIVFVVMTGLLFGGKGGLIAGIVFGLTALGLTLLGMGGHLPGHRINYTPLSIWVFVAICLEVTVILQLLANHSIKTALNQARQAEAALRQSRDELEVRVQERTAELRNVNQELEAFSYSVSHDLRRPLRAVTGFTDLLVSEHGQNLPADAQKLFSMIRQGAEQMNQLIEVLLNLSRIERMPLVPRPVNMTELARQTAGELRAESPGRKIEIRVADLPECIGDPALLRQVFINLFGNAIKYTRNRPVALIEAGFKKGDEPTKTIYFVRDNGVGFDMRYADKLFGAFQRLHAEFDGSGVGLSIVRRIIHRHGGSIWAEAVVDQGATFYFTIPLAPQSA